MKTSRLLGFAFGAIAFGLLGCGEIENPTEPTPDPKPEEVKSEITIDADIITNGLSFTSATGEKSISFTTNEDWTLSIAATPSGDAWCSASTTSGAKGNANVKFSVTENTSYDDRSVSVTIKSGTASKTFNITQKYAEALLLTTNKYEVGQEGGTIEIEVKANIDYEMEIADNAMGWITETKTRALTAYKHTLNISANEEVDNREGEIHFKSGDKIETVKIYQEGAGTVLVLSQKEYTVSDTGGTISVDIKSNIEYGVQMPDVDWISDETATRSMSSHTLKYTVSPNEEYDSRSAEIIFYDKNSELKDTLKIVQVQKDAIVVAQSSYNVENSGGNIEIELMHNVEYDYTISVDWIKKVETKALTADKIIFAVAANTDYDNREGKIVFTSKENSLMQEVTVFQSENEAIIISKKDHIISSEGGEIRLEIQSNIDFVVSESSVDWLHEVTTKALQTHTIKYQVDKNETYDSRSTQLTVTNVKTGKQEIVNITQTPKDAIIVAKNEYTIDAVGGKIDFDIYTNVELEISTSVDWIEQSLATRGLETKPLSFIIAENPEGEAREGIITISCGNLKQEIKIIQKAKMIFEIAQTLFEIRPTGGEFDVVVSTNGEYKVTLPQVDWIEEIIITSSDDHIHSFSVAANETFSEREAEIIFTHIETNENITVKVVQAQTNAIFIESKGYVVGKDGGNIEVKVVANIDYQVKIKGYANNWIQESTTRSLSNFNHTFIVAANQEATMREAEILFTNEEYQISEKITIYQDANGSIEADGIPYITFNSSSDQSLRMDHTIETLEYSVGESGVWTSLGTTTVYFGGDKGALRLRGKSSTGTAQNLSWEGSGTISFGTSAKVLCSGDIRTLIDYENYSDANTSNASFCRLFKNCTQLISAPELPATTLSTLCYGGMFWGCTNLTSAPELPATTLAYRCYEFMFNNCENLTIAPELPATTLAGSCYTGMFSGCTSLTSAPELPATTLADACYHNMFQQCTGLKYAPELPATTLAGSCYYRMFAECTGLTSAPELPATTLAQGCYQNMFSECSRLTEAPQLPATTLTDYCYASMFSACTSLTSAPELPATTLYDSCYRNMFNSCVNLTSVPELPATTLATGCYYLMFANCSGLTSAPELPATTLAKECYSAMFYKCESLTSAPELPATSLAEKCYAEMFLGCSRLISAPRLPATTLTNSCYYRMFKDCSDLIIAPILNAETLVEQCYYEMFSGCYELCEVIMLATRITSTSLTNWLKNVASEGFIYVSNTLYEVATDRDDIDEYRVWNNEYKPRDWQWVKYSLYN